MSGNVLTTVMEREISGEVSAERQKESYIGTGQDVTGRFSASSSATTKPPMRRSMRIEGHETRAVKFPPGMEFAVFLQPVGTADVIGTHRAFPFPIKLFVPSEQAVRIA